MNKFSFPTVFLLFSLSFVLGCGPSSKSAHPAPEQKTLPKKTTLPDEAPKEEIKEENKVSEVMAKSLPEHADSEASRGKEISIVVEEEKRETIPAETKKDRKKRSLKRYAEMTFDSLDHHLPDIIEGENFKHEFVFENTSDVPLTIMEASSSCGCTTPSYTFLDIPPGAKSKIGVDYFSVNKEGPQEAVIELKANTKPSKTKLTMVFNVLPREKETKKDTLSN